MKGRKPIPTDLKRLNGNRGKRPLPQDEPQPALAVPVPPEHLDDEARTEWGRVTAELLAVGTMALLYRAPLAAYCMAFSRWKRAEEAIQTTGGEVVKSPSGFPIQNPYLAIANKALHQMTTLAAEFGMTPSAKTKIKTRKRHDDENDLARLLLPCISAE